MAQKVKNKIFLFPLALAVIFFASIIIIFSPVGKKNIINLPVSSPVIISSPDLLQSVKSPITLIGKIDRSWVFEASFPIELFDNQNKSLYVGTASVPNWTEGDNQFIDFTANIKFSTTTKSGILEIRNDNPSGMPENDKSISIPVIFSQGEQSIVKLFYHNPSLDPQNYTCDANDFISVSIPKTATPLKDSIEKLISQYFLTDKTYGSRAKTFVLNSANIKNNIATLTFSDPDFFSSGGSCRVSIISDMIIKTALQFSTVKEVKFIGPNHLFQP